MRRLSIVLVAMLLAAPLLAQEPTKRYLDITGLTGDFHLQVTATGVSVVPISIVMPTGVPPSPTPNPPPGTPQSIAATSEAAARAIDDATTARNLAVAYTVVVVMSEGGAYDSVAEVGAATVAAAESILDTQALKAKWAPYRAKMASTLTRAAQDDQLGTVAAYTVAVGEMRDGLVASTTGEGLAAVDFASLFSLIKVVLDAIGDGNLSLAEIIELALKVVAMFDLSGTAVIQ